MEKVEWGVALPKESWLAVAARIKATAPLLARAFEQSTPGPKGREFAEEYMTDMQIACLAIAHVADFAVDKCRFIVLPDQEGGADV